MLRPHRGFTLIEQIAALTLIGTAAAGSLPALQGLRAAADASALAGMASALGSAMLLNQAGCALTDQHPVPGKCEPVADCSQAAALLAAELPAGWRILPAPLPAGPEAQRAHCTLLREQDGASAPFIGIAAGR